MRNIDTIVIHCSATPNGVHVPLETIDAWHAKRGFMRHPRWSAKYRPNLKHIGYHHVIGVDGIERPCRAREEIGAHVAGSNAASLGICLVGTDAFSLAQWAALERLLESLAFAWAAERLPKTQRIGYPMRAPLIIEQFRRMGVRIVGHRDLSPDANGDGIVTRNEWLKTCPGFDVSSWLKSGMTPEGAKIYSPSQSFVHRVAA
jgi:hypothetical protein